ncbi:FAD-binding oxidoreductase [Sporomusa acidovorans]|uniref:FAD-linked oxidoreductase n=1 Tax=Sporomusa acidovorans (strain ATCC 49682 / DSM 3132 / Mol) TaxID=1123286 RepID=A0ABZ3IW57_SPOA4|nr:FAD-binding oxidoreductase [Sporomusa acidovorans]OZC23600.1 putative FAD-linked oxidoreductase [Sporomusa acidovorans DSM 3132]SDE22077.1 glycolate oxidase [Sporomusa acidovorans]
MSHSVSPQSIEELRHVLRTASATGRPLYVYWQGKSAGVTVDLSKLDEIAEIDAANLVVTVGPGVKLGTLAQQLAKWGLRFLPGDNPFYRDKTVGQFFYEGYSNLSSLKYGSAKHFLMGSEVVLPTGELLKTGGKTVKNVTGYDFTRFFNAPYTDFGVTAKFLLKLLPLPETRKGFAVTFDRVEKMLAFVGNLKESRVIPAYLLWMDGSVQRFFQDSPAGQLIMLEFDGVQEDVDEQCQSAAALVKKHNGAICEAYEGDGQTAVKWSELYRSADHYLLTDEYKMAFTCQAEFMQAFGEIAKNSGVEAGLFGQVSEGKLNIAFKAARPDDAFIGEVAAAVKQAGGISSGKYARLQGKCPSGILGELEQRAKAAFDPQQIINRPLAEGVK